jgi:predicted Rossmann-fold nucleotide-binding protein
VDVEIPCDNLTDRKQLMMVQSDVFIALPGGIGTLDEMFTVAASATIGYHQKSLILYNMKGFWDSLIALLDDLQAKGMIRGNWRDYIKTANSIEQIDEILGTDSWTSQAAKPSERGSLLEKRCFAQPAVSFIKSRVNPCLISLLEL